MSKRSRHPCHACNHSRLLHDSWGCKLSSCGCRVSVIYIKTSPSDKDKAEEQEIINLGNRLDVQSDELAESHVEELLNRVEEERPEQGS